MYTNGSLEGNGLARQGQRFGCLSSKAIDELALQSNCEASVQPTTVHTYPNLCEWSAVDAIAQRLGLYVLELGLSCEMARNVPMHPPLAQYLKEWRAQSPYSKVNDFVFPSLIKNGKVPISASTFVKDHLRPAAISAGVVLAKGQRFGLHNLRHSLSTWLVNKGKVDPKTVQGMLRHSDIRTTMNLYTQDDRDEKQAAQGAFLSAVGLGSRLVQ